MDASRWGRRGDSALVLVPFSPYRPGMEVRDRLVSSIAFALTRCKSLFKVLAQSHNTDEARQRAAEIIADHVLERAGLDVTAKPTGKGHSTPGR